MAKGKKEFEASTYVSNDREPEQSEMGASILNYGEERFGVGVEGEEPETYAEPGEEGMIAVGLIKAQGGISSHEKFEGPMQGTPTGE